MCPRGASWTLALCAILHVQGSMGPDCGMWGWVVVAQDLIRSMDWSHVIQLVHGAKTLSTTCIEYHSIPQSMAEDKT